MAKKKTRKDTAQIARENLEQIIGEKLTGEPLDKPEPEKPKTRRQTIGRLGGLRGGLARAKKLSKRRRSQIAKNAAERRWKRTS